MIFDVFFNVSIFAIPTLGPVDTRLIARGELIDFWIPYTFHASSNHDIRVVINLGSADTLWRYFIDLAMAKGFDSVVHTFVDLVLEIGDFTVSNSHEKVSGKHFINIAHVGNIILGHSHINPFLENLVTSHVQVQVTLHVGVVVFELDDTNIFNAKHGF